MPLSKENQMQMAISIIKNQKCQSKRKISAIFAVSEATLHNQLKGIKPQSEICVNGHKLIDLEEEVLIKYLINTDKLLRSTY